MPAYRQVRMLREEGKLPKGGLEAGKMHGLTKEDLQGAPLRIFKPSDDDLKRLEYVPLTINNLSGLATCPNEGVRCGPSHKFMWPGP